MMEALSQTWNNSRKVAKCWEFDMVQNAFCCFTFFFREREAGLLLILYLSCTRCSWYVVDSSLLISSKRQGTNLKRAKRGGLEYIKLKFTCTYIQSAHGFALWLKLFKSKKKCTRLTWTSHTYHRFHRFVSFLSSKGWLLFDFSNECSRRNWIFMIDIYLSGAI